MGLVWVIISLNMFIGIHALRIGCINLIDLEVLRKEKTPDTEEKKQLTYTGIMYLAYGIPIFTIALMVTYSINTHGPAKYGHVEWLQILAATILSMGVSWYYGYYDKTREKKQNKVNEWWRSR